jgi:adenylyl-sulfate kinase
MQRTTLDVPRLVQRRGFTLWLTGLSGAGKSTLARALADRLALDGIRLEILDGDEVRENLSKGLGFSREDRDTNIRRIAWVAKLLTRNGVGVITAAISPYAETRNEARRAIGNFVEVYVRASLDTCIARDPKGLYRRAIAGDIPVFTGVSDPYEPPTSPALTVDTERETVEQGVERIVAALQDLGYLRPANA